MDDMLRCPLCNEIYDNNEKIPKSLPCGHSSCILCVGKLLKKSVLKCYHCEKKFNVPRTGIGNALPTNFTILTLLVNACGICKTKLGTSKCDNCHEQLCDGCYHAHSTNPKCNTRTLMSQIQEMLHSLTDACNSDEAKQKIRACGREEINRATKEYQDQVKHLQQAYNERVKEIKAKTERCVREQNEWQDKFTTQAEDLKRCLEMASLQVDNGAECWEQSQKDLKERLSDLKAVQADHPQSIESWIKDIKGTANEVFTSIDAPNQKGNRQDVDTTKPGMISKIVKPKTAYKLTTSVSDKLPTFFQDKHIRKTVSCKVDKQAYDYTRYAFRKSIGKWGTGPVEFRGIRGICTTDSGLIVVADALNDRIQLLSEDLEFVHSVEAECPYDVCSLGGKIYITQKDKISVMMEDGEFVRSIPIKDARGITVDDKGYLYVCDHSDGCVKIMRAHSGMVRKKITLTSESCGPCYISIMTANRNVYVSDDAGNVHVLSRDGAMLKTFPVNLAPLCLLATGLATDSLDNIIIPNNSGSLIVMSANGQKMATIGSDGQLAKPQGLVLCHNGNILVADGNKIIMFASR